METTNHTINTPEVAGRSSCHGGGHNSGGGLSNRRTLFIGGGVIALALALALSQHWLSLAALAPLLYVLPCALLMLMCMKSMHHSQNTGGDQAAADTREPAGANKEVR